MIKQIDSVSGNIVDVINRRIFPGTIRIAGDRIVEITEDRKTYANYIIPGLIDAHIHIESSLLIPSEFARLASVHGTVATVSDPHEIGNVLGIEGVRFMLENAKTVPFKFYFGAPSCVPATPFETAGGEIGLAEIETLFKNDETRFLSEMMNVPGVLNRLPEVMEKLELAKRYHKKIDGHAPALRGVDAQTYIQAGITTDHECISLAEAEEKIRYGMYIQIREGSAAKNFDELYPLMETYPDKCMLCSDDKHPDDLEQGHINDMVKKALRSGMDTFNVLRSACVNPVKHYDLDVGLLQPNDSADFVVIDNFEQFTILQTVVDGKLIAEAGETLIPSVEAPTINRFRVNEKTPAAFAVEPAGSRIKVMEVIEGQLVTGVGVEIPKIEKNNLVSDVERDLLKITVVNRYRDEAPAVGFIRNFGLKKGAVASSVAHDSHNIVAVGVSDEPICRAVNLIVKNRGGLCVVSDTTETVLPLPVAGLMSAEDGFGIAQRYAELDRAAKALGTQLRAPFMTLSFMALLVIPKLKLSDQGLFDGEKFEFTSLLV